MGILPDPRNSSKSTCPSAEAPPQKSLSLPATQQLLNQLSRQTSSQGIPGRAFSTPHLSDSLHFFPSLSPPPENLLSPGRGWGCLHHTYLPAERAATLRWDYTLKRLFGSLVPRFGMSENIWSVLETHWDRSYDF